VSLDALWRQILLPPSHTLDQHSMCLFNFNLTDGLLFAFLQLRILLPMLLVDQGENNGENPGLASAGRGYACLLPAMIRSWRREFAARGASAPDFPFGIVNLHGWCGEEEGSCNPGYPNAFGPGKNVPMQIATQDVSHVKQHCILASCYRQAVILARVCVCVCVCARARARVHTYIH
jgi:hypothetical protein